MEKVVARWCLTGNKNEGRGSLTQQTIEAGPKAQNVFVDVCLYDNAIVE